MNLKVSGKYREGRKLAYVRFIDVIQLKGNKHRKCRFNHLGSLLKSLIDTQPQSLICTLMLKGKISLSYSTE